MNKHQETQTHMLLLSKKVAIGTINIHRVNLNTEQHRSEDQQPKGQEGGFQKHLSIGLVLWNPHAIQKREKKKRPMLGIFWAFSNALLKISKSQ